MLDMNHFIENKILLQRVCTVEDSSIR